MPIEVLDTLLRGIADVSGDPDFEARLVAAARTWLEMLRHWETGHIEFDRRRYDSAVRSYDACQQAALQYMTVFHQIDGGAGTSNERWMNVLLRMAEREADWTGVWGAFRWRRILLSLAELHDHDLKRLAGLPTSPNEFKVRFFTGRDRGVVNRRVQTIDIPLITIACVLAPLARAEANRLRRQFDSALTDIAWVLNPGSAGLTLQDLIRLETVATCDPVAHPGTLARAAPGARTASFPQRFQLICEFIERPFAKLLMAETLLAKADAEYKARLEADPPPPPPAPGELPHQGLQAAFTYQAVLKLYETDGEYLARVRQAGSDLEAGIDAALAAGTTSPAFQELGKTVTLPTVTATQPVPGFNSSPHEPLLRFTAPAAQPTMREVNPRVYQLLLTALAKATQIGRDLNYLGYRDDYVPPWRFTFLLERARYFTEHAKNAQREYLNFLATPNVRSFRR